MSRLPILPLLVLLLSPLAGAADLARETRIAAEIADAILDGVTARLRAGDVEFLAIHTEPRAAETRGAVILLHGRGAHPDWSDVIHPLRVGLPDAGWHTLSIQLPVAAADAPNDAYAALIPEAAPRIAAAVAYCQERKLQPVAIVAHSLGARMAAGYLAGAEDAPVTAFVAIGLSADAKEPEAGTLGALARIRTPTLDLYGSRDLDSVLGSVVPRAQAARRAGNPLYEQIELPGADHFFRGLDDDLVSRVAAWLHRVTQPSAAPVVGRQ
jgi:pimeloyl-ACP methyl ester carboxylesterase